MSFPLYEPPTFLVDGTKRNGIGVNGACLIGFGADAKRLAKKYDLKQMRPTTTFKAPLFERFLAKWAYCTAVRTYGLDHWQEIYVLGDILGVTDTIGSYVGTDRQVLIGEQPAPGAYLICESKQRDVVVRLKLFASYPTPEYSVVVGRLAPLSR